MPRNQMLVKEWKADDGSGFGSLLSAQNPNQDQVSAAKA
jgi:hypothetical protein